MTTTEIDALFAAVARIGDAVHRLDRYRKECARLTEKAGA